MRVYWCEGNARLALIILFPISPGWRKILFFETDKDIFELAELTVAYPQKSTYLTLRLNILTQVPETMKASLSSVYEIEEDTTKCLTKRPPLGKQAKDMPQREE